MARNAEKAMTTLARWRAAQVQEAGGQRERRPYLASECNDLPQAEKWRLQIVREIAKKVAQIQNDDFSKYDEIFTKMNTNELKIRVPKSTKLERIGKYDKIQEICSCEDNPYNTGDQIQFELPKDMCSPNKGHDTYTSHLKYTYNGCNKSCESRDRKIINVTPSNCPIPVNMEKQVNRQKDVFILKIGKKLETKDKKTDLEIELVTPKALIDIGKTTENHISQQCSSSTLKDKPSKLEKKKNTKKGKKSKISLGDKKRKMKDGGKKTKKIKKLQD